MQFVPSCDSTTNFSSLGSRSTTHSPRLRSSSLGARSVGANSTGDLKGLCSPTNPNHSEPEEEVVIIDDCFDQPRSFSLCSEVDFSSLRDDFIEPDEDIFSPRMLHLAPIGETFSSLDSASSPESEVDVFPSHRYVKIGNNRSLLGRGASGFVFCAVDLETCDVVALKETPLGYREGTAQLENEMDICRELDEFESEHFVPVIEGGVSDTMFISVAPFMNGGTLRQYISRCMNKSHSKLSSSQMQPVVDEDVIQHIAVQVTEGLVVLHDRNHPVIHNDLKPENILLTQSGRARICDFGLSVVLDDSNDKIDNGRGTLRYFSPEKFRNFNYQVDIWALGVTLYECVVGRVPVTPVAVGYRVFQPDVEALGCVSLNLRDFILSCFIEDPQKRPTAKELMEHPFLTTPNVGSKVVLDCCGPISGSILLMDIIECLDSRKSRDFPSSHAFERNWEFVTRQNSWDQLRRIAEATNLSEEVVRKTILTWPLLKRGR